jgi:hypothetical protein
MITIKGVIHINKKMINGEKMMKRRINRMLGRRRTQRKHKKRIKIEKIATAIIEKKGLRKKNKNAHKRMRSKTLKVPGITNRL